MTVTSSTKLKCFRRKHQESFKTAEYLLHLDSIHDTSRSFRDQSRPFKWPTLMSESSLIVIVLPSLVYPYFKLDIEKMKYAKSRQSIKIMNELIDFAPFC